MKHFLLLLAALLPFVVPVLAGNPEGVVIDPTESRGLIRQEILRHTPPGSTMDQVRKFIKEQLLVNEQPGVIDAPASGPVTTDSGKQGAKSIRILLGRYITNPLLLTLPIALPLSTDVSVQWDFDRDGKLTNVFVEKALEGS
jgi:hypothetical protein